MSVVLHFVVQNFDPHPYLRYLRGSTRPFTRLYFVFLFFFFHLSGCLPASSSTSMLFFENKSSGPVTINAAMIDIVGSFFYSFLSSLSTIYKFFFTNSFRKLFVILLATFKYLFTILIREKGKLF